MKVTICAYDAYRNLDGPTIWLKRLALFLKERKVECRIIFFVNRGDRTPLFDFFLENDFACTKIYWDLFLEEKIQAVYEDIKMYPPDVFIPQYFVESCEVARGISPLGIPSLMIIHNDNAYHYDLVDEFLNNRSFPFIDTVAAVSKSIEEVLLNKKLNHVNIRYLTYGAPIPKAVKNIERNDKFRIIFTGRFNEEQKRVSLVAKMLCKLVNEIPDAEAYMYGDGESLPDVLKIIETEGKGAPVYYGGLLTNDRIQEEFLKSHVYILLSNYEGLPVSLVEAMAAGVVPVCSNMRSGINQVIVNEQNGFVLNDAETELVRVIEKLKSDPQLWSRCSTDARSTIMEMYSVEVCNDKWLDLIKELAGKNSCKGNLIVPDISELANRTYSKTLTFSHTRISRSRIKNKLYRVKKVLGFVRRRIKLGFLR
ncbi:glycosyltransferase family 4 protein [Niabella hirudinis]|uniref:glycosyltransferase family 4 protein n=1 Tax=Niabella hirudinis TaxID=1285929 RepID=UPI003EBCBEDC